MISCRPKIDENDREGKYTFSQQISEVHWSKFFINFDFFINKRLKVMDRRRDTWEMSWSEVLWHTNQQGS